MTLKNVLVNDPDITHVNHCQKSIYYKLKELFVMKTNQMHYSSLIYFVNKPLHVSGMFIFHHQKAVTVHTQRLPPDDGQ
jgi:hypothetical protein